jgi:hypothetical protein
MTTPPSHGMPYWLAALAALLGFVLAQRRAEHRPVAWFLGVMVAIDVARLYLRSAFHLDAEGPYHGAQRAAFHAEELGFLAWPFGLGALALVVFAERRRPWLVLAAWAAVGVALVALYPSDLVRADGLQRVYLAAHLAALAAAIACVASWGRKRIAPGSPHAVLFVIGALEVARLVPFYGGSVFDQWSTYAPATNAILYGLIVAIEGGYLVWASPRSS